jgi:hypothetical protein
MENMDEEAIWIFGARERALVVSGSTEPCQADMPGKSIHRSGHASVCRNMSCFNLITSHVHKPNASPNKFNKLKMGVL